MQDQWIRTRMLLGGTAMKRLRESTVAVFGLGGVGGAVVEALARSGVGRLVLVDHDRVSLSNLNRQILALHSNIGQRKVDVARARIQEIDPGIRVEGYDCFYLPGQGSAMLEGCDYVVDAVDTVAAKLALIEEAGRRGIPILCSMGTGNKLDPFQFEIAPIEETSVCPLCRVMRRELKKRGIEGTRVLYSREIPLEPEAEGLPSGELKGGRVPPGSTAFVPPVAGYLIASAVVRDLIGAEEVE